MKMVAKPEEKTVTFTLTPHDEWHNGRTGRISCVNGFKAEFKLIKAKSGRDDWDYVMIHFLSDEVPVKQSAL